MKQPPASSDRDLEEARLLQHKLREIFSSERRLGSDAYSLQTVKRICDRAVVTVADEHCQEMFCEIDRHAEQFFSTGRGDRGLIRLMLESISERLSGLEALQRAEGAVADAEAALEKR